MSEKARIRIEESYLQVEARLREPSLRLAPLDYSVAELLVQELLAFGPQLETLALDASFHRPAEGSISLSILDGFATVKLSPSRSELTFQSPGNRQPKGLTMLPQDALREILSAIERVVRKATEQERFAEHTFTLSLHARLLDAKPATILRRYLIEIPSVFGAVQSGGVRYVFKGRGVRKNAWMIFEPSARIVPDGLYFSGAVTLDGAALDLADAADDARAYLRSVLSSPEAPVEVDLG